MRGLASAEDLKKTCTVSRLSNDGKHEARLGEHDVVSCMSLMAFLEMDWPYSETESRRAHLSLSPLPDVDHPTDPSFSLSADPFNQQ